MSRRRPRKNSLFGLREWMGDGWWVALALSLIMIVALRNRPVGAPNQISTHTMDSLSQAHGNPRLRPSHQVAFERDLRAAARELSWTRVALEAEKERVALLQESYEGLDDQFRQVTDLVRSSAVPASFSKTETEPIPVPIEAIFVRSEGPAANEGESQ